MHDAEGEATNLTALGCCKSLTLQLHGGLRAEVTIKTYIQLRQLRKTLNAETQNPPAAQSKAETLERLGFILRVPPPAPYYQRCLL